MDEKEQMGLFQRGASQKVPVTKEALVASIQRYNAAYRAGKPLIGDGEYDRLVERLRALEPEHAFLNAVEPQLLRTSLQLDAFNGNVRCVEEL